MMYAPGRRKKMIRINANLLNVKPILVNVMKLNVPKVGAFKAFVYLNV